MLIAMTATLAGASRLQAAPRDPKVVARAKLVEGAQLLGQGEYEEALMRFQEAYARVPSPKIFYNYGLAYRGLGRNAEAITAFDRFLAEASDAAPDKRADGERRRAELLKKVATLEISAEVEGADIVIDGTSYGQTPRTTPIYLDSGNHLLSVRKGSAQHVQRLTAERGQKQTIVVALTANAPPAFSAGPPALGPVAPPAPSGGGTGATTPEPATDNSHGSAVRVAAWSTAAAAVVFVAGGAIEMVVASHKLDQFQGTLAPGGGGKSCGTDQFQYGGGVCNTLHDEWSRARTLGLVGLVGGGALAAASVTLFVISTGESGDQKVACAPALATLGVSCAGRF
jgi:hypothetical protein